MRLGLDTSPRQKGETDCRSLGNVSPGRGGGPRRHRISRWGAGAGRAPVNATSLSSGARRFRPGGIAAGASWGQRPSRRGRASVRTGLSPMRAYGGGTTPPHPPPPVPVSFPRPSLRRTKTCSPVEVAGGRDATVVSAHRGRDRPSFFCSSRKRSLGTPSRGLGPRKARGGRQGRDAGQAGRNRLPFRVELSFSGDF